MSTRDEHLERLDVSLLALRRIVAPPPAATLQHAGTRVELSTVLVVDALTRAEAAPGVGDVAEALQVTHSTASRLVDRAVTAGAVERTRHPGDPRRALLMVTPQGATLQRAAVRFRTRRLAELVAGWAEQDVATLAELLERFAVDAHRRPDLGAPDEDPPGRTS
jgi:DNA-binding MarR family transcriptional regulator